MPLTLSRRGLIRACLGAIAGWPASGPKTQWLSSCATASPPPLVPPGFATSFGPRTFGPNAKPESKVEIESSDQRLVDGFQWAKTQALAYVFTGDPVGPWYEAALPRRQAFCMRDVAHQSIGAQVLGLAAFNKNMLRRFAENISGSRDWCTYWEINRDNKPAPVDYRNDQDFWYCLPANFDVLNCCYQQYLWTGDRDYIEDPVFLNFYDRTVLDYVKRWDQDGDGIPESYKKYGFRGLGSYDEDLELHPLIGGDLIAAQYAAYVAYARIQSLRKNGQAAREYQVKADNLRAVYNSTWWSSDDRRYQTAILQDWTFHRGSADTDAFTLWFGITDRVDQVFDALRERPPKGVEVMSYLPEVAYQCGRNDYAYAVLLELTSPHLKRREYPEVSYSVVRALVTGTMGISADATGTLVQTFPRLTRDTAWVAIRNLPVFSNEISVRHIGNTHTSFTNQSGPPINWSAAFPTETASLLVDGSASVAKVQAGTGLSSRMFSYVGLTVKPGESMIVRVPDY